MGVMNKMMAAGGRALWGFVAAAGIAAALGSCASLEPLGETGDGSTASVGAGGLRGMVLEGGETFLDITYVSPSRPPANFDCSGFVRYVFQNYAGMSLPASSAAYASAGEAIDFADARPGDLLIFTSEPGGRQINHVAILYKKSADGELRGSWLLHAISIPVKDGTIKGDPDTTGVKISELGKRWDGKWRQEYFAARYFATRRVIKD